MKLERIAIGGHAELALDRGALLVEC